MTERWRKKLEGIDGASPSDDVFERAKEGPMHSDDPLPGPRMSTRVITIVAAFLVFALAISVFAIPALRIGNQAAGQGSVLLPLWPAQTSDQLEQLQANPPSWALDPQQVAEHFAQEVMGWSGALAHEAGVRSCGLRVQLAGLFLPALLERWQLQRGLCGDRRLVPGSSLAQLPVCHEFRGSRAGRGFQELRDLALRPGTLWLDRRRLSTSRSISRSSRGTVRSGPCCRRRVRRGCRSRRDRSCTTVRRCRPVSSSSRGLVPTLGYGSCGQSEASSAYHSPGGSGGAGIQSDVHLTGGCEGEQPGYVWAATSNVSLADTGGVNVDPFAGGRPALASITAAPVTMIFPTSTGETTASPSPTPEKSVSPTVEPSQWTTFDGGLGFTMELPADWGTTSLADEIVVNAPEGDPYIQINRVNGPPRDDSTFPLNFADYENDNQPHFYGDGQTFIIQWLTGTPDPLTPEQSAVVERIVESIKFQHWQVGDQRNGWTAVGEILPASSAEWMYAVTGDGENYLATNVDGSPHPVRARAECVPGTQLRGAFNRCCGGHLQRRDGGRLGLRGAPPTGQRPGVRRAATGISRGAFLGRPAAGAAPVASARRDQPRSRSSRSPSSRALRTAKSW